MQNTSLAQSFCPRICILYSSSQFENSFSNIKKAYRPTTMYILQIISILERRRKESDEYSLTVHLHGSSVKTQDVFQSIFLLVIGHKHLSPGWEFKVRSHGSATIL